MSVGASGGATVASFGFETPWEAGSNEEPLPLWSTELTNPDDVNFTQPPSRSYSAHPDEDDDDGTADGDHDFEDMQVQDISGEGVLHTVSPVSDLVILLPVSRSDTTTAPPTLKHLTHRYLVSSQILRVVSPVWRRHLDPDSPFQKIGTELVAGRQHIVMALEDDDPDTLLALLNVLHFSTENIPTASVDFAQLRSFAVLCDKYDCVHVLNPYSKSWLDRWASGVQEPGYEDWLFIAKVFKDERGVRDLERSLVEESSSLSACGSYFFRKGIEVSTALIPEVVLRRIMAAREAELKRQIDVWRRFLQTFVQDNVTKGCPNWDCVTLSYGNLIRSVEQSGLFKVFNLTDHWHGNIKDFEEKTGGIHLANGTRFHGYGWCPVENLNVSLRSDLERSKEDSKLDGWLK
ncbi:hypothetical protein H072_7728 [Dactylellina haptotyla CBS 200.50]|uniref:BTB domain-containing protein n=1 Tax=Dactylellina haptotyla (strain CBS 200.50) TaxID=1284197 RepID=S8A6P9_DACHA|nr:hypothetical protein H072_7728 [Dactylellina haptotyla CBS 200.50]